jgi:hypothetical protein
MIDFRRCTQKDPRSHEATVSFARIKTLRDRMVLPIGEFVWARLIAAVDGELANQLIDPLRFKTVDEIRQGIELVCQFTQASKIDLPVFLHSMTLLLEYEGIITNGIPFESKIKDVPPAFFVALVFAGKRKRVIRLEVSDARILDWAEYVKVDFSTIDSISLSPDESHTEIPLSLWS